jgi:hypothetical protein
MIPKPFVAPAIIHILLWVSKNPRVGPGGIARSEVGRQKGTGDQRKRCVRRRKNQLEINPVENDVHVDRLAITKI